MSCRRRRWLRVKRSDRRPTAAIPPHGYNATYMRILAPIPDLPAALRALLAQVPRGRVTTPGRLAAALGNAIAARWIGHYLLHHDHRPDCPCHRVVRAGGVLGPYPQGGEEKRQRLAEDGVDVVDNCVAGDDLFFDVFLSDRPLAKLARYQDRIAKRVSLRWPATNGRLKIPQLIGGVDVSYGSGVKDAHGEPGTEGVAAYALVEMATGKLVWSTTIRRAVGFPYISSYLTFRELPLLLALLEEVRRQDRLTSVILVDGTGVLHPRCAGIASHLGVVSGIPTIGVIKKLLCGQVNLKGLGRLESRPVVLGERPVGIAIRPDSASLRPLFVSPGSGIDLGSAERVVRSVLTEKRLPLPLYWADRLSRQGAKNCDKLEIRTGDHRKRKN
jgi:deoxyribonuclease V